MSRDLAEGCFHISCAYAINCPCSVGCCYHISKVTITGCRAAEDAVENGILSKTVRGSLCIW